MFIDTTPLAGVTLLLLSLVAVVVATLAFLAFVVSAGKDGAEGPEPRGQAIYVHLVLLVSLFVALLAATAVVASLAQLIGTNTALRLPTGFTGQTGTTTTFPFSGVTGLTFGGQVHPVGDAAARGAVGAGIVLLVAALLFIAHWPGARRLWSDPATRLTNAGRIVQAYLNTATLVAVLILLVAASLAGYAIFEAAAPGVTGVSGHVEPLRTLVPLLFLTVGAALIIDRHRRVSQQSRAPANLWAPPPAAPAPSAPPPSAPTAPPTEST
jgi:hypothetical protein